MLAHSAQSRDPIAVCRSRSHAAFRQTGHPKQHSPSSSWSTKCATSFSPSTAPTFRTRHENNGNHRRPIGRSSRTTNCHSDRRHQLKTGPSAPFAFCQLQQSAAQTVHRRYAGTPRCPNTSANKYGFTPAPTTIGGPSYPRAEPWIWLGIYGCPGIGSRARNPDRLQKSVKRHPELTP